MFELFTVSNITHNLRSEINFSVDIARALYIRRKYFSFSCIEDLMTVPQIIRQLMNLRQKQKSETNKNVFILFRRNISSMFASLHEETLIILFERSVWMLLAATGSHWNTMLLTYTSSEVKKVLKNLPNLGWFFLLFLYSVDENNIVLCETSSEAREFAGNMNFL